MNTMREFYDAVNAIIADAFMIKVEVWQHRHENMDLSVDYTIWDGVHHHSASTPELALDSLRTCQHINKRERNALDAIELLVPDIKEEF